MDRILYFRASQGWERVSIEDGKFIVYACDVKDAKNAPLSILDDVEEDGSRYVLSRYIREKKNRKEDVGPSAYFVFEKMSGKVFERYCNKLLAKDDFSLV